MARWKSHDPVPDTYFCGGAVLMDGYPSNYLPKESRYTAMPYWLVEARTPGSTLPPGVTASEHTPQAVVTRMKGDGAICVKTFFERGFGGVHNLRARGRNGPRACPCGAPRGCGAHAQIRLRLNPFALDTGRHHRPWPMEPDEKAKPGELTALEKSVLDRSSPRCGMAADTAGTPRTAKSFR
jgi:hypothetical protein